MKTVDQFYSCQMPGQVSGHWQLHCHLRIFRARTNVHTVMIADMGFEIGWFNPFVIEKLVDQVVQEFRLDPAKLVWLEHYTSHHRAPSGAAFSQVAFEWQNGKATNPQWLSIEPAFYANSTEPTQLLDKLNRGEQLVNYKLQLKTVNREIRDTLISAGIARYERQQAIPRIWTDITEPKQTQQTDAIGALTQVESALQESEAQFRSIAAASPVATTISRVEDGLLLYASDQVEQTFGLLSKDLVGRQTPNFYDDAIDRQTLLRRILEEKHIPQFEVRAKKANGTLIWVSVSLRLITFHTLLLQAGTGWQNGLVGSALVSAQASSHLGYVLLTQKPVLIADLRTNTQFRDPPLLHNHRVISGIGIPVLDQSQTLGVLSCYTTQPRTFTQDDVHFLQAIATVLASATSRHQSEAL